MSTCKYIILLIILLVLPFLAEAQIYRAPTKVEAEQIGKKIYVISTGDTTRVVNTISGGLTDEYSKFLFRKSNSAEVDSILSEGSTDYNNLEEAVLDIDRLLREVGNEKKANSERNSALGFRLARENRNQRKKEQTAMRIADSLMRKDATIEDLTRMYIGFNGKPTYYINGLEVPQSITNKLYPEEVIKREMRVSDTASGNPFGEVWYIVSEKTLSRINIPIHLTNNNLFETNVANSVSTPAIVAPATKKPPKAPEPVIRREIGADGKQIDRVVKASPDKNTSETPETEVMDNTPKTTTRVISRTVNDEKVGTDKNATYIMNRPGIKRVANPPQSSIRQQHYGNTNEENVRTAPPVRNEPLQIEEKADEDKPKSTPKKSVRRIKERLQNQYKDRD
ncbi:hypothetical protein [Prevotella sp. 10(H)]|uniref:hypothetical protein n=1 Tax=Prevotella sp. 10(H) TaxID=1158294 RepID=UPI0004A6CAD7|nr:hypothetical protein [Prevotella sp. 10(H)]